MKVEISVPEVVQAFKEIQEQPEKILEMVKVDMPRAVGEYLREIMKLELTRFLGRHPYQRVEELELNHRNGSYPRSFALKGIGEVAVKVPRDRKGEYQTRIIPRSKQYEDELRQDIAVWMGYLAWRRSSGRNSQKVRCKGVRCVWYAMSWLKYLVRLSRRWQTISAPSSASSRQKALEFATQFAERWQKAVPSAVKCLQNSLDSCLTFFDFPEDEWISLRTTYVIERLNKKFKRRIKPMEIVAGESTCYTL